MKPLITLLLLLSLQTVTAQFSWNAELNLQGMASTEEEHLPFWMNHNQRGRTEKETNFASWVSGKAYYDLGNTGRLEAGAGFLGRDASSDDFFTDELYLTYQKNWLEFTVGRKQRPEAYNGLSASNESILWSLNARPLPGLQLQTTRPVFLFKNFGFEAAWEEYLMDDDFLEKVKLHHKSFHFVYSTSNRNFTFKAGLQHFAQWGGSNDLGGEQPESLEDYIRIITGMQGGETAGAWDQQNALGNHLGGYELSAYKQFSTFELELFYQHLFEDGSGRRLGNTPDGRYGLFVTSTQKDHLVNSLMYEFYTTHHQSHTTSGPHKNDNYFNGNYGGWAYFGNVVGAPFFSLNENETRVINNKFTAHHLGISGNFSSTLGDHRYRLLLSYAQNDGTRPVRFEPKQDVFYALYDVKLLQKEVELNLQFAAEYDNYKAPVYGAGLHLVYRIE
ncbi:Capsule assembly protein Wzi [Salinimicrobium catena]|uniref:Capsule assembly protein Wzi n=1 Tax=Salinimicrobium catena TaxID=390640 RepID=A0A1H5PE20_9FLAO|nr:capsule assembly Wzi family protein [Salinimicrobium catena]SDL80576.1 Capsule assembly protein Wzi [Salinimicrobium catena]SEF12006.1 Capsule assembly protein Wzi [Salinimicrobium catena]